MALGLVAGCAREAAPAAAPGNAAAGVSRLELRAVGAPAPEPFAGRPLDLAGPHEVRGGTGERTGGALVLAGDTGVELVLPGPFDPSTFDQVAVTLGPSHCFEVGVVLERGDELRLAPLLAWDPESAGGTLLASLPENRRDGTPWERLVIVLRGVEGSCRVEAVELVHGPAARWLPEPAQPALVEIGRQRRRGLALERGAPLEAALAVPPGGRLAFSHGVPEAFWREGDTGAVEVALLDARGRPLSVHQVALRATREGEPMWDEEVLEVGDLAGRAVRARVTLASDTLELCAVTQPQVFTPQAQPPGVLLVTSDTHRADHVGAAPGSVGVATPGLDALAARGVLFVDCFATTNITNPSHVALMTGVHPRDTRILWNDRPLAERAHTLAERFHAAGWLTFGAVSAQHLAPVTSGLGQGFDRFSVPAARERVAARTVDALERWLTDARDRPVFAWVHLFDAHSPYDPPEPFDRSYYPADRDPFDPRGELPPDAPPFVADFMPGLVDPGFPAAQYRGEVSYLDRELTRLLRRPRFERGIVAVTADHGESLGEHDIWWNHGGLYPESVHVPLILAWPGAAAGMRVERPVRQVDVGRTLLDLAGLERAEFPGRSLVGAAAAGDDDARFALAGVGFSASITSGGLHLILHLRDHHTDRKMEGVRPPKRRHAVELFDLTRDPGCTHDLSAQHDLVAPLRARLVEWLAGADPEGLAEDAVGDAALASQLAQLGYVLPDDGGGRDDGPLFDPACDCESCAPYR